MLLEARIIGILRAKNYEYWFRLLQVIEDEVWDIFFSGTAIGRILW